MNKPPFFVLISLCVLCFVFLLLVSMSVYWIFTGLPTIVGEDVPDRWENLIGNAIVINARDFFILYKTNVVIQIFSILFGVSATVVASITSNENAYFIKYVTIFLTLVSSVLISVQSVFHVRENLNSYIAVNTDLTNLQQLYLLEQSQLLTTGKSQLQLELETAKVFAVIQEMRWRSFAIIGQKEPGDSAPISIPPVTGQNSQSQNTNIAK